MQEQIGSIKVEEAASRLKTSIARAFAWLKDSQIEEGFHLLKDGGLGLQGICGRVLLLEGMQRLEVIPDSTRATWIKILLSFLNQGTGSSRSVEDLTSNKLSSSSLFGPSECLDTYFALHALDAFGFPDRFPPGVYLDNDDYINTFDRVADFNPDRFAPIDGRLLSFLNLLIYRFEIQRDPAAADRYHKILDELQRREDLETGFIPTQAQANPTPLVNYASLLVRYFEYVHKPILHLSRKIDTLLALPLSEGINGGIEFDGLAEALIAVPLLANFSRKTDYRSGDIHQRLAWIWRVIQRLFEREEPPDCLFSNEWLCGPASNPLPQEQRKDYLFLNTWLCLGALAAAGPILWAGFPLKDLWRFRRWPSLGFYRPDDGLDDYERRVLPEWIQHKRGNSIQSIVSTPIVSVIMPCYNLGAYLPEAVNSVLDQTWQDFEIIIVDDGSTDEYTKLVLETARWPKTRIVSQSNFGLAAARNRGIREAQGKYICCLDADDCLLPEYLEKAVGVLDSQPETGFITSNYSVFDERESVVSIPDCNFPELLVENRAMVASLFRKEAWSQAGGYYENFSVPGFEDWDLWISLVEAGWGCATIPEVLFAYRIRNGSMYRTALRNPEKLRETVKTLVLRHSDIYGRYIAEVVSGLRVNMADLLQWISKQEEAKAWWEGQTKNWKMLVQEREKVIEEQRAWIEALQDGKGWLEEQLENWKKIAEEREQQALALKKWIGKLERGKRWLEEQMAGRER